MSRRRLAHRILLGFAAFATGVALLFSAYVLVFAYEIEDAFFAAVLDDEAQRQRAHWQAHGALTAPGNPGVQVVARRADLPADLLAVLAEEPERVEAAGRDGSHYHLRAIDARGEVPGWVVMEVGDRLVVRPRRGVLFAILAVSAALCVALAVLVGARLARRVTRPLAALATTTERLDPDRLPDAVSTPDAPSEVAAVAQGLDRLLARIRAFTRREREFARDASHELRTPLAVVRGAVETLAARDDLPADSRDTLALIRDSTADLEQTVTALLALARERPFPTDGSPVRLGALLERLVVEQSPRLGARAVEVELDVDPAATSPLPEAPLRIVLANLVGNAFAHAAPGVVRIALAEGWIRVENPRVAGESPARESHGFGLALVHRLGERFGIAVRLAPRADTFFAAVRVVPGAEQTTSGVASPGAPERAS